MHVSFSFAVCGRKEEAPGHVGPCKGGWIVCGLAGP